MAEKSVLGTVTADQKLPGLCDGEFYCLWERQGRKWVPQLIHDPGPYFVSNAKQKPKGRITIVKLVQIGRKIV